jgi:branched-chain amino acid transport system ATP-binding protein
MAEVVHLNARQAATPAAVLSVRDLNGWYGESHVLHGIEFDVAEGEALSVLGRNGAGKTTTMKAINGILAKRTGSVVIAGQETIRLPPRKIAPIGLGYVPEERGIFGTLSVQENLTLPPVLKQGGWSVEQIFELFPNLKQRLSSRGKQLSGGEQQMLAIARILRTGARLLLMDEPTEGLAPVIVDQIGRALVRLKQERYTIVLVEQNFRFASRIADRHIIIEQGRVVDAIPNSELDANVAKIEAYLGV